MHGRREHGVAVPAAFALLDAKHLALTVDIGDFQRHHLTGPKPGAIANGECRLVFNTGGVLEQALDILSA